MLHKKSHGRQFTGYVDIKMTFLYLTVASILAMQPKYLHKFSFRNPQKSAYKISVQLAK